MHLLSIFCCWIYKKPKFIWTSDLQIVCLYKKQQCSYANRYFHVISERLGNWECKVWVSNVHSTKNCIHFFSAKPCPPLDAPLHGSVMIPCVERFGATCVTKCTKGHYLVGSMSDKCVVDENGDTMWTPNNATCKGKVDWSLNILLYRLLV